MNNQLNIFVKYLNLFLVCCFIFSCKKEHLDPTPPAGTPKPMVYISASLESNSVYLAGGINAYVGSTTVNDTNHRIFNFTLKNPQNPLKSYFQISINNYKNIQGVSQSDLDSTVYTGPRNYQHSNIFTPCNVTVLWTDSAGVIFTSNSAQSSPHFSINAVENVVSDNKNYKKATIEFVCSLSDPKGHIIHLTNGKAIILFAAN